MFHVKLFSTNNSSHQVSIREAVLQSLPPDNGLYMPEYIPELKPGFITSLNQLDFAEISLEIARLYFGDIIPPSILEEIIVDSINFHAPVITIDDRLSILELFHGPTLAFKDFGARFMARVMNYFWKDEKEKLHILVATSGDTGGAVAAGFYGLDNIEVTILYPKNKVSELQKNQLTTWGKNIEALEIEGNFDDCQKLVKEAFLDKEINDSLSLSSANSINIARLIPQTFYYFESYKQMASGSHISFVVPSGNFGNLTAGLFAKRMGLPIHKMIAATNDNDVFTNYIETGNFSPKKAVATLSNAMDIGVPSNFTRIMSLYGSTWNDVKKDVASYSYTDPETISQIVRTHDTRGYVLDPHTAVGVLAAEDYLKKETKNEEVIVLSTAHPIKFAKEISPHISFKIPYPAIIHKYMNIEGSSISMEPEFKFFKEYLLSQRK